MNGEHLTLAPTVAEPHERRNRRSTLKIDSNHESIAEVPTTTKTSTILVGFDWGTSCSCIHAAFADSSELALNESIPTLVGYAMEGIMDDILPSNARILFGNEAIKHRLRLRLTKPMADGVIKNLAAAKDFAGYVRSRIDPSEGTELRAVIGLPANAEGSARENLRQTVQGLFDRVILIPEPFLAALGYRDESRLADADYQDPVGNSLFVDIGAGTTDLCVVQGYFPAAQDQVSIPFGGDEVDNLLSEAITRAFPDTSLSMMTIRQIKEQNAFVGNVPAPVMVDVLMGGKTRKVDLTEQIRSACEELLKQTVEAAKVLIARGASDSVGELLQNIVLTGGGSRIRGFNTELQRLLTEEGYESPRVHLAGDDYKQYMAKGALRAARQTKEASGKSVWPDRATLISNHGPPPRATRWWFSFFRGDCRLQEAYLRQKKGKLSPEEARRSTKTI